MKNPRASLLALSVLFCTASSMLIARPSVVACGTVTDAAGRPIPGVTVEMRAAIGTAPVTVTTGADGEYVLPNLAAGTYGLTFVAEGFKKSVRSNIAMADGHEYRADHRMEVALPVEAVDVSRSASVAYDKPRTTVGGTVHTATSQGPQRVSPCGPVRLH